MAKILEIARPGADFCSPYVRIVDAGRQTVVGSRAFRRDYESGNYGRDLFGSEA